MQRNCWFCLVFCLATVYALPTNSSKPVEKPPHSPVGPFDGIRDRTLSPPPKVTNSYGEHIIEGDIKYGKSRAGTLNTWPNGIIPYVFHCSILDKVSVMNVVYEAMYAWESTTCVRFVEKRPEDVAYLEFIRLGGCWATRVGYSLDKTQISIGQGCDYKHVMVHELGHVIGYWHEQSRTDRDDYISILRQNVIPAFLHNFGIAEQSVNLGQKYDMGSIMHYPYTAFTRNGHATIRPRVRTNLVPYTKLSKGDIKQTNLMYKCSAKGHVVKAPSAKGHVVKAPSVEIQAPTDVECKDKGRYCVAYAQNKLCSRDEWVFQNCLWSCGRCNKPPECLDKYFGCSDWAKSGQCSTHQLIREGCPESCGLPCRRRTTPKPRVICQDKYSSCAGWKKAGYCSNHDQIKRLCPITCRTFCGKSLTTKPPAPPTTEQTATVSKPTLRVAKPVGQRYTGILCYDRSTNCDDWRRAGRCLSEVWVYRNCLLSCQRHDICDESLLRPEGRCSSPFKISEFFGGSSENNYYYYATSTYRPGGLWHASAEQARLYLEDNHQRNEVGGWCADPKDKNPYLIIGFHATKYVSAIATQGRASFFEHVESFYIEFSFDRTTWVEYKENGKKKIFTGNCDNSTPVLNTLQSPARASFIKIVPVEFVGGACLRVELYGC